MPAYTPFLSLYKMGGGSTGLITPDETVDVDRINQNMDAIDSNASSWGNPAQRNHQFYGSAAGLASVTGMKRGDTYQESDGSFQTWVYNGSAWVKGLAVAGSAVAAGSYTIGTNRLYRVGRVVNSQIYVSKSTDFGTAELAVTIPTDFRPMEEYTVPAVLYTAGYGVIVSAIQVATNGEVKVNLTASAGARYGFITGSWVID